MKHYSLKEITLLAAAILGGIALLSLLLFSIFINTVSILWVAILSIFSFIASYFVIHYLVDKFIYRRIKLIYKSIYKVKTASKNNPEDYEDVIKNVEDEVKDYRIKKAAEIDELKKMEQYRKDFLGDVSHELKTPIFNTQGYIETLLDGAINDVDVNKIYLKKASKNLDRLSEIVEDLVLISKHESGNLDLQFSKFNIIELIKEVFEQQEMTADLKDIKLEIKKDVPNSILIKADKRKIQTVLNNLVNNAIKYGKEDGLVLASAYIMEDNVLVEITDNGPGIEQEHLPRLFDRFYRIDKHRSRFDGGTGLGLAISKHIMEAHKQTIHVRSTIDIGTTFGITLDKA